MLTVELDSSPALSVAGRFCSGGGYFSRSKDFICTIL